jgi:hypothetical protein
VARGKHHRPDRFRRCGPLHDGDAVAELSGAAQIVGDEEERQVEALAQIAEKVEDLRLNRDVQRRNRLVGDDQLGIEAERAGDADVQRLPAGKPSLPSTENGMILSYRLIY